MRDVGLGGFGIIPSRACRVEGLGFGLSACWVDPPGSPQRGGNIWGLPFGGGLGSPVLKVAP